LNINPHLELSEAFAQSGTSLLAWRSVIPASVINWALGTSATPAATFPQRYVHPRRLTETTLEPRCANIRIREPAVSDHPSC
jgi:hypothetical protein